jgi:hypothetical protein
VSRSAEAGWHAPWVHRLVLLVSIPGRAPYVATCRLYAPDILEGATVLVTVSPLWSRRVTIDLSAPQAHPARANVLRGKADGPPVGSGYHPIPGDRV